MFNIVKQSFVIAAIQSRYSIGKIRKAFYWNLQIKKPIYCLSLTK